MSDKITMLDLDAFKDVNFTFKINGNEYVFKTPNYGDVLKIQSLYEEIGKHQTAVAKDNSKENNDKLNQSTLEMAEFSISLFNDNVPSEYLRKLSSLKLLKLCMTIVTLTSEAFTGGAGSGN